uniref:Uncharacterized protein n=1 Tax=Siphoviridae sp. ctnR613 TaxID=2827939 RepID=A0A8S5SNK3_9CAUD|nr:MAG TPA: hypothetical protein [Siphoviridae sp. ctnR613]
MLLLHNIIIFLIDYVVFFKTSNKKRDIFLYLFIIIY